MIRGIVVAGEAAKKNIAGHGRLWVEPEAKEGAPDLDGRLILGWANLGALIEDSLKWYMRVYYETSGKAYPLRSQMMTCCGCSTNDHVLDTWYDWVEHVRYRRNAIHSF